MSLPLGEPLQIQQAQSIASKSLSKCGLAAAIVVNLTAAQPNGSSK
jgi:hypothetical protein